VKDIKKIGTHDGRFHTDEVLAIAALQFIYPNAQVVRTRDEARLAECDIRIDVGRKYDPVTGDYDHHQGGIPTRENGIEFSSFGLIWREFGVQIAGDEESARYIEEVLVQPVDARDNGQELVTPVTTESGDLKFGGVKPFEFEDSIDLCNIAWDHAVEPRHVDTMFGIALSYAHSVLQWLAVRARGVTRASVYVREAIARAEDSRLILLDHGCPWQAVVVKEAPEAVFMIFPDAVADNRWFVQCIPRQLGRREYRKELPAAWRGLDKETFVAATGVPDAQFVHQKLFICVARSREGALALAQLALAA
jgi:uncharacterized UPF0160 family protein